MSVKTASIHSLQERIDARTDKVHKLTKDKSITWQPLTRQNARDRLAYGRLVSFDQTLTSCGVALVSHDDAGIRVVWTALIKPEAQGLVGFQGTYTKAIGLRRALEDLDYGADIFVDAEEIVHEMPSTGGHRTESSLLAGYVVQQFAAERLIPCSMIANASMRALLVPPDRRADRSKVPVRESVDALVDPPPGCPWNEHVRDAVGLALTRLKHLRIAEQQEQP